MIDVLNCHRKLTDRNTIAGITKCDNKLCSNSKVELLASYFTAAVDKSITGAVKKKVDLSDEDTVNQIVEYLPRFVDIEAPQEICYISNGVLYSSTRVTKRDIEKAVNLVIGKHPFTRALEKLIKDSGILSVLTLDDKELTDLVKKIDFKFTNLNNLLTAMGMPLNVIISDNIAYRYNEESDTVTTLSFDEEDKPVIEEFEI